MKSARAAISIAKNVISFPLTREQREKHDTDFLPAALEIVETPPSPIGRAIGASIVALFCLGLIWASFGHIDIVASASGKIVPSGRVKLIQAFETGVVRAIHVRDGQHVKEGDKLIELDPTMTEADQDHVRSDLVAAQLDMARLHAELSDRRSCGKHISGTGERSPRSHSHTAAISGQTNRRISDQARHTRSPADPKGGGTQHRCCQHRKVRSLSTNP